MSGSSQDMDGKQAMFTKPPEGDSQKIWSENAGPAFMAMLKDKKYEPLDLEVPYFWTKPISRYPREWIYLERLIYPVCTMQLCPHLAKQREQHIFQNK